MTPAESHAMAAWFTFDRDSQTIIVVYGDGYPGIDSRGNEMYNNTHFRTFEECREHTRQELYLMMVGAACAMKQAKENLNNAITQTAERAAQFTTFVEFYPLHKGGPYGK